MDINTTNKVRCILDKSDKNRQTEQFIEECSEAILAVQKLKRYRAENTVINAHEEKQLVFDVIGEIADVLIMAEQMKIMFGEKRVIDRIDYKLDRQIQRIRERERNEKIRRYFDETQRKYFEKE